MNLLGGFVDEGMESIKVVEVPSEIIASPGVERAITLAGLSPVKGATRHSISNSSSDQARNGRGIKIDVPGLKPHL